MNDDDLPLPRKPVEEMTIDELRAEVIELRTDIGAFWWSTEWWCMRNPCRCPDWIDALMWAYQQPEEDRVKYYGVP